MCGEYVQDVPTHLHWVQEMRPEEAAFLKDLPFTLSVPSHRLLIVHAGFVPNRDKARQTLKDMFSVCLTHFCQAASFIWQSCSLVLSPLVSIADAVMLYIHIECVQMFICRDLQQDIIRSP